MDNYSRIEKKKNRATPALKVLKRASKSYEALQQGFILCLLNTNGYGIVFSKPDRRSIKTIQTLAVKALILPNGFVFEYEKELERHCNRLADDELRQAKYYALSAENIESIAEINKIVDDGYDIEKLKQIKRHREANKNSIAFNWLVKYAEDIGYKFGKRSSKPAQFTTKMVKITSLLGKEDTVEMNQDVIEYIGIKFNQHVFEQFTKDQNELIINGKDEFIYNLVNNHDEVKGTYLKSMYEEDLNEANAMSVNTFQMSQNNNSINTNNNESNNEMNNGNTVEMNNNCNNDNQNNLNNVNYNESVNDYINHINEMKENEMETNKLNQSIVENNNDSNSQHTTYNQLPEIELTQHENVDENEEMEMKENDNQSTQTQEYPMDEEMIRHIKEYYDNYINDGNYCYSFIQCYNYNY